MAWRRMLGAALTPLLAAGLLLLLFGGDAGKGGLGEAGLRVGYVATLLNGPVLVGLTEGRFQEALGDLPIETRLFSAGPLLVEALFAGEIDIAYVGPSPAINAWVRSDGKALRIVASVSRGGSGLVVRDGWQPAQPDDFAGRILASPQVGNTQDVSLRFYIAELGARVEAGGSRIIAAAGPELQSMLLRGEIDGAWVAEPWLTRLLLGGAVRLWINEEDLVGAYVAVRPELLDSAPDLLSAWLRTHISLVEELNEPGPQSSKRLADALAAVWQQSVSLEEIESALQRVRFDWQVSEADLRVLADRAFQLGLIGTRPPELSGLVVTGPLERAGKEYSSSHKEKEMSRRESGPADYQ